MPLYIGPLSVYTYMIYDSCVLTGITVTPLQRSQIDLAVVSGLASLVSNHWSLEFPTLSVRVTKSLQAAAR